MSFQLRLDISRCIGCRACEVACVTANDLPPAHSRNWVPHLEADSTARSHATFAPYLCSHCEDPPCVPACPTGASYQAEDGRVLVDQELCIGCGLCVPACPYDARHVEPVRNLLEKCTLCDGRIRAGRSPACFEVCPADARHYEETQEGSQGGNHLSVGDPSQVDNGHDLVSLTSAEVDPRPRLRFSGRPEDLSLLREQRPPTQGAGVPSSLWRNGAGWLVQGLGAAAAAAMAGMVAMRWIRERRGRHSEGTPTEEIEKDGKQPTKET